MALVRVSKRFTVNMGNYESYAPEFSVELEVPPYENFQEAIRSAQEAVDEAAYHDLKEAAVTSNVKDTYILTWLHNRKDKTYGRDH
jgi:hypothetical protein